VEASAQRLQEVEVAAQIFGRIEKMGFELIVFTPGISISYIFRQGCFSIPRNRSQK
jgi:hypothetical protein